MYSSPKEGKSIIAERFIRTLKTKIYKCMTSVSKNGHTDEVDDIANKYNNRPADVKPNRYIDPSKENNERYTKFKIGGIGRISKYKNIFVKDYTSI